MYSFNFTKNGNEFWLSMHYNGANSYLTVNGKEIHKFKLKDSDIIATPLCLQNVSKDWSVDNMKKTGLNGYVYDFSVDYDAIAVDDILDIRNYVMKKNDIAKCLGLLKSNFSQDYVFLMTLTSVNSLSCILINNQECRLRPQTVNVTGYDPVFLPYSVKASKCSCSCNNIKNPLAKLCVPDIKKLKR